MNPPTQSILEWIKQQEKKIACSSPGPWEHRHAGLNHEYIQSGDGDIILWDVKRQDCSFLSSVRTAAPQAYKALALAVKALERARHIHGNCTIFTDALSQIHTLLKPT